MPPPCRRDKHNRAVYRAAGLPYDLCCAVSRAGYIDWAMTHSTHETTVQLPDGGSVVVLTTENGATHARLTSITLAELLPPRTSMFTAGDPTFDPREAETMVHNPIPCTDGDHPNHDLWQEVQDAIDDEHISDELARALDQWEEECREELHYPNMGTELQRAVNAARKMRETWKECD